MTNQLLQGCVAALLAGSMLQSAQAVPARADLLARAEQGDVAAQVQLAIQYRDGVGGQADPAEAVRWAQRAVPAAMARQMLGVAYFRGSGVKRDMKMAFGHFQATADEFPIAAFHLGECYYGAQGVEQNVAKALEFWEKAAEMGHGRAAASAAMAYLTGEGLQANPVKGRRMAERAAELMNPSGLVLMGEIHFQAGEMDKAQDYWTKVAALKPVGPTGQPNQPSDEMAAQQGADLLKLIEWRQRKPEPGRYALVPIPHIHQGYNNCGATSCAMVARFQGQAVGGWDFKRLCPSPIGTGTDWAHLLHAAEKLQLPWKLVTFTPDEEGLRKGEQLLHSELDAGRPVVIDFKFYGERYVGGSAGHTLNLVGYLVQGDEVLYILCNPAIASPGLSLITREDLGKYWRSDGYSKQANNILSRPALVWGKD